MHAILNNIPGERSRSEYYNSSQDYANANKPGRSGDTPPGETKFSVANDIFDHTFVIGPDGQSLVPPPEPTAAETAQAARDARNGELKVVRERKEYGYFTYDGNEYQCRRDDQPKIKGALTDHLAGLVVLPFVWITRANTLVTFATEQQLKDWNQALSDHVRFVYTTYVAHQQAMLVAPDPAAYNIEANW